MDLLIQQGWKELPVALKWPALEATPALVIWFGGQRGSRPNAARLDVPLCVAARSFTRSITYDARPGGKGA
jgi:hypothetical protein